jgi:two-component system, OmpR family, sensor histidine kinase BaeS
VSHFGTARIGVRIALAALAVSVVSVAVVSIGVTVVGGNAFMDLMTAHGESAAGAQSMFESTVLVVLVVAIGVAAILAGALAWLAGRWLARPLRDVGSAARRIASGEYGAQIARPATEELASLVDSFNQMSASLAEQERMRREFVSNAAHELRTPLTNLKGYLEGLRDGVIDADQATFESLWEETERLVRLSESLDRLEDAPMPAALADVDVRRAIETAVVLSRPAGAAKRLAWEIDAPDSLAVHANPDHLAQVLANLLQNAVRYTPAGGAITIRAEQRPSDVLVSVRNSGATISADELPKVFERFYRVDRSRDRRSGGAGIGLAIVKQLVETAGGRVGAESADGRTTFWFSLPRG